MIMTMTNSDKYIFSGYAFDNEGPYLILDQLTQAARSIKHVRGAVMTLTIDHKEQHCIGRYDILSGIAAPCPRRSIAAEKRLVCVECNKAIAFNPAYYNRPEAMSEKQRMYNEQPHVVYLALFTHGVVKVGTANVRRVRTRWLEQGARLAVIVCECSNAYSAREMEVGVSELLGVGEAVRGATKRKYINMSLDSQKAHVELEHCASVIASKYGLDHSYDIEDLNCEYLGHFDIRSAVMDLTGSARTVVSGRGIGMIGEVLLLEQAQRKYMFSLKSILGRVVQLTSKEERVAGAAQMELF